jgi:hypothetical protein
VKLVIDIDGCTLDFYTSFYFYVNGKLPSDPAPFWDLHKCMPKSLRPEDVVPKMLEFATSKMYEMLQPCGSADTVIQDLKKDGHTILFCTHSGKEPKSREKRLQNLQDLHIPFDNIRFVAKASDKVEYCKAELPEVIVEDYPETVLRLAEALPKSSVLVPSYPYNEEVEDKFPNIVMVERNIPNWWEVIGDIVQYGR